MVEILNTKQGVRTVMYSMKEDKDRQGNVFKIMVKHQLPFDYNDKVGREVLSNYEKRGFTYEAPSEKAPLYVSEKDKSKKA